MLKIKFDRLDYQELAVNSISDVFKNIAFKPNDNKKSNPSFDCIDTYGFSLYGRRITLLYKGIISFFILIHF